MKRILSVALSLVMLAALVAVPAAVANPNTVIITLRPVAGQPASVASGVNVQYELHVSNPGALPIASLGFGYFNFPASLFTWDWSRTLAFEHSGTAACYDNADATTWPISRPTAGNGGVGAAGILQIMPGVTLPLNPDILFQGVSDWSATGGIVARFHLRTVAPVTLAEANIGFSVENNGVSSVGNVRHPFSVVNETEPTATNFTVNFSSNNSLLGTASASVANGASVAGGTSVIFTAAVIGSNVFNGWFNGGTLVTNNLVHTMPINANTTLEARFTAGGTQDPNTVILTLRPVAGQPASVASGVNVQYELHVSNPGALPIASLGFGAFNFPASLFTWDWSRTLAFEHSGTAACYDNADATTWPISRPTLGNGGVGAAGVLQIMPGVTLPLNPDILFQGVSDWSATGGIVARFHLTTVASVTLAEANIGFSVENNGVSSVGNVRHPFSVVNETVAAGSNNCIVCGNDPCTCPVGTEFAVNFSAVTTAGPGTVSANIAGSAVTSGSNVASGSVVNFVAAPGTNVRFLGWFEGSGATTPISQLTTYPRTVNAAVTLEARFAQQFLLTLNGIDRTGAPVTAWHIQNETVNINAGSSTGWGWTSWTVVTGGITAPTTRAASFSMPGNAVTLTANWGEVSDVLLTLQPSAIQPVAANNGAGRGGVGTEEPRTGLQGARGLRPGDSFDMDLMIFIPGGTVGAINNLELEWNRDLLTLNTVTANTGLALQYNDGVTAWTGTGGSKGSVNLITNSTAANLNIASTNIGGRELEWNTPMATPNTGLGAGTHRLATIRFTVSSAVTTGQFADVTLIGNSNLVRSVTDDSLPAVVEDDRVEIIVRRTLTITNNGAAAVAVAGQTAVGTPPANVSTTSTGVFSVVPGTPVTITPATIVGGVPSRPGYTFQNWEVTVGTITPSLVVGPDGIGTFNMPNLDITINAVWLQNAGLQLTSGGAAQNTTRIMEGSTQRATNATTGSGALYEEAVVGPTYTLLPGDNARFKITGWSVEGPATLTVAADRASATVTLSAAAGVEVTVTWTEIAYGDLSANIAAGRNGILSSDVTLLGRYMVSATGFGTIAVNNNQWQWPAHPDFCPFAADITGRNTTGNVPILPVAADFNRIRDYIGVTRAADRATTALGRGGTFVP